MTRRLPRTAGAGALALLLLASCGDSSPTGEQGIAVSAVSAPAEASPGAWIPVSATVTPRGGARVDRVEIDVIGVPGVERTIVVPATGRAFQVDDSVRAPLSVGAVRLLVRAEGGRTAGESDTLSVLLEDLAAPVIDSVTLTHQSAIARGDPMSVRVWARDDARVGAIVVEYTGVVTWRDSTAYAVPEVSDHRRDLIVASNVTVGGSFTVVVRARDLGGNVAAWERTLRVTDDVPPMVVYNSVALTCEPAGRTATPCLPGDTVRLTFSASDDHEIAWIGYRASAPAGVADSLPLDAATGSISRTFVVPREWLGETTFTTFVRDSSGNQYAGYAGRVLVLDERRVEPAFFTAPWTVHDVAWDARRSLLWVGSATVPEVRAYALDGTHHATVALPRRPGGMDFGTGAMGDTLVVALRGTGQVARIPVATSTPTVSTVRITGDSSETGRGLASVRLTADNRLVATLSGFDTHTDQLIVFDLGAQQVLATHELGAVDPDYWIRTPLLVRSADRTRIVAAEDDGLLMWDFDPGSGALTGPLSNGLGGFWPVSVSPDGSVTLSRGRQFDDALAMQRVYWTDGFLPAGNAIAPDGQVGYLFTHCCANAVNRLSRRRLTDGQQIDSFLTSSVLREMQFVDATHLISRYGARIYVIDVTQLPPLP